MKKKVFTALQYLVFTGGGLFLVWWQLRNMTVTEATEFKNSFRDANYLLIIPIVIMSLASHVSRAMRWKILMAPLGYTPSLKTLFPATMVGYLANSAVPRLGEVLKCTIVARYEKLKADKLIGTILVERAFDMICYLLLIAITLLIQLNVVGNYAGEQLRQLAFGGSVPLWMKLIILIAGVLFFWLMMKLLFAKYPKNKIVQSGRNFFSGMAQGFLTIKHLKNRSAFVLHSLFIWTMYLLQIYVGFSAMDSTSALGLPAACSVLTLATLAMIVTPGGIGSFPFFVMNTLLLYQIAAPKGTAFGWLMWGVSTGIIVVAGVASLLLLPYLNRKNKQPAKPGALPGLTDAN